MMLIKDLWIAEYSAEQRCFNVDCFKNALIANARMVAEKQNNDYLIFGYLRLPRKRTQHAIK